MDSSKHSLKDLVEEIGQRFIIDSCVTSIDSADILAWLMRCAGNDSGGAYAFAHEAVRRLRSDNGGVYVMDIYEGFKNNAPPNYTILT
ncbi:hypothetical protein G7048_27265 (plasmid) [Diaphorobacter sp. HDW4B]|uniref:hypothetical protein n=1 Tax=Diaphorobacter sp. HDW4B TaxID=2714925 RepID=UPI00140B2CB2|nr:hypothetical protein [Diaphorobacter sp. HDW4B]QIL74179.1 hypothetical protein G7048_27265 [Diaphorobacter sp. HDW4B]